MAPVGLGRNPGPAGAFSLASTKRQERQKSKPASVFRYQPSIPRYRPPNT
nr:MAG TPA: hypothetical protein [Caudoviricetes sp.]